MFYVSLYIINENNTLALSAVLPYRYFLNFTRTSCHNNMLLPTVSNALEGHYSELMFNQLELQ